MKVIGAALVARDPEFTQNAGKAGFDPKEISRKILRVIERNDAGDCLCVSECGSYLVDVDSRDVQAFMPISLSDPIRFMSGIVGHKMRA
jgi:hypothetical protein